MTSSIQYLIVYLLKRKRDFHLNEVQNEACIVLIHTTKTSILCWLLNSSEGNKTDSKGDETEKAMSGHTTLLCLWRIKHLITARNTRYYFGHVFWVQGNPVVFRGKQHGFNSVHAPGIFCLQVPEVLSQLEENTMPDASQCHAQWVGP